MANEDVLGPRKTMFVLVIVVGCFAVLWPRILSPLILGVNRDQLKPNQFDRDAGCCEVLFDSEVAMLKVLNEICSSVSPQGTLSPYAAAECRKTVNDTCGVDIAAFLQKSNNVGKTAKKLIETMKESNSSCLEEHFGVPMLSWGVHPALNSWNLADTVKQERPPIRTGMGPHPALRERGRAIPAAAAPAPRPAPLPPHLRVRSPLEGYFEIDIKPPPIPGMRPPLGAPGGPVQAPKSSMGFVMPIYTICIIIFFVYTLAKILFKRTGSTSYDPVQPDAQFRRRVFRDDSRQSSDKLVVTAISGLVAEVQQQMQASYDQSQQQKEAQDNARPYTNGSVIHKGPVQIIASEYKEKSPKDTVREENGIHKPIGKSVLSDTDRNDAEVIRNIDNFENKDGVEKDIVENNDFDDDVTESKPKAETIETVETEDLEIQESPEKEIPEPNPIREVERELLKTDEVERKSNEVEEFLRKELEAEEEEKKTTSDLLEEALKEDSPSRVETDNGSVKVVGMELTMHSADGGEWPSSAPIAVTPAPTKPAHEAEDVKMIYLETDIPDQSRVIVTDFADQANKPDRKDHKNASLVVSGKMTLSLIQDLPRETPEKELDSTLDEFTTASGITQAVGKEDDLSEEEIEEEIEVEEIEYEEEEVDEVEVEEIEVEEVEVDEEEIEEEEKPKPKRK